VQLTTPANCLAHRLQDSEDREPVGLGRVTQQSPVGKRPPGPQAQRPQTSADEEKPPVPRASGKGGSFAPGPPEDGGAPPWPCGQGPRVSERTVGRMEEGGRVGTVAQRPPGEAGQAACPAPCPAQASGS